MNNELRAEIEKLKQAFPGSYTDADVVFVAHKKTKLYLCLIGCTTARDIRVRAISRFSRACVVDEPYRFAAQNRRYHSKMLQALNKYLGTDFTLSDVRSVQRFLGEDTLKELAEKFVDSDYDMTWFKGR